jgi:hypothetical protein
MASCVSNFGDSATTGFFQVVALALILAACLVFAGGISAIKRRKFWLAFIGAIAALFILLLPSLIQFILFMRFAFTVRAFPYLIIGLAPIILTVISKNEFK